MNMEVGSSPNMSIISALVSRYSVTGYSVGGIVLSLRLTSSNGLVS